MLYYYKIGYYSWEMHDNIGLLHKEEFNKQQFEDMFVESVLELLLNKRDQCNLILAEEGEIPDFMIEQSISKKYKGIDYHYYSDFMSIYDKVAEVMVEKYGFEKVKYKQEVNLDGFVHIVEKCTDYTVPKEEKKIFNRISKEYWKTKKNMIEIASIPSPGAPE